MLALGKARLYDLRTTLSKWPVLLPKYQADLEELKQQLIITAASESASIVNKLSSYFSVKDRRRLQIVLSSIVLHSGESGVETFLEVCKQHPYDFPGSSPDDTEALFYAMEVSSFYDSFPSSATFIDQNGRADVSEMTKMDASTNGLIREKIDEMVLALALQRYSGDSLLNLIVNSLGRVAQKSPQTLEFALCAVGLSRSQINELQSLGLLVPMKGLASVQTTTTTNPVTAEIEKRIIEIEDRIKQGGKDEREAASISAIEFGANDELFALWSLCFTLTEKGYTYSICPFQEAKQDGYSLGKHDRVEYSLTHTRLHFTMGSLCYGVLGSPSRKFVLDLVCSPVGYGHDIERLHPDLAASVGRLEDIIEVEPCSYTAQLLTALACE